MVYLKKYISTIISGNRTYLMDNFNVAIFTQMRE